MGDETRIEPPDGSIILTRSDLILIRDDEHAEVSDISVLLGSDEPCNWFVPAWGGARYPWGDNGTDLPLGAFVDDRLDFEVLGNFKVPDVDA